jgi:hypothetical protein
MAKLHELLAVETSLETQALKVRTDLAETFAKKRHLFEEKRVTFTPNTEGAPPVLEQQSSLQSTVAKELEWVSQHITKALDASYQVAEANTKARADLVLDDEAGTVLLKNIPATSLLELEKRMTEVRELLSAVPTLDPAKSFEADTQKGPGIFRARDITKARTKKDIRVIVKYEATKEHPAQTEMVPVDTVTGTIAEQEWSGMITPAQKSELLDRAEQLIRAVRRARSRANDQETDQSAKIGHKLLSFVVHGKK